MIALESFVAAIACLCASTFDPQSNTSITTLRENCPGTLTNSDTSLLKALSNCDLPDMDDFAMRLNSFMNELEKQGKPSERLERDLQKLSSPYQTSNNDCQCTHKDAEIKALQEKIANLEAAAANPTQVGKKSESLRNMCLLTDIHGVPSIFQAWPLFMFCDQHVNEKHGWGWMLVAQRFDGSVHFYRSWFEYTIGFGIVGEKSEFFLGLKRLFDITNNQSYKLLIVMTDNKHEEHFAHYGSFVIGSESEQFALKFLGKFYGDAGDSLRYHVGQKFSTYDRDNDESMENCAKKHSGAWWYKNCYKSNLFGIYETKRPDSFNHPGNGMLWSTFQDKNGGYLTSMKMYVRKIEF